MTDDFKGPFEDQIEKENYKSVNYIEKFIDVLC